MEKYPFISYHRINDTFETIDLKIIRTMHDPIVLLKCDKNSGLFFGSDLATNMIVLRISRTNDLQILRHLPKIQADFAYDLAFQDKILYYVSHDDKAAAVHFISKEQIDD